jgi:hypothetical protein
MNLDTYTNGGGSLPTTNEDDVLALPSIKRTSSKSGTNMAKLSNKTSQIISDYHNYLREIESELPSTPDSPLGVMNGIKSVTMTTYQDDPISPTNLDNHSYSPQRDVPLRRGWDYGDDEEEGSIIARGQSYTHPSVQSIRSRKAACTMGVIAVAAIIVSLSVVVPQKKRSDNLSVVQAQHELWFPTEEGLPPEEETLLSPSQIAISAASTNVSAKWYPKDVDGTKECVFDNQYDEMFSTFGLLFDSEKSCCKRFPEAETCGEVQQQEEAVQNVPSMPTKEEKLEPAWYPAEIDGKKECAFDANYDERYALEGFLFANEKDCCRKFPEACNGSYIDPEMYGMIYQIASTTYQPMFFDRSSYNGQTYAEAAAFCEDIQEGYGLCPYDALCPLGVSEHSVPMGGVKQGGASWNPVSVDGAENEWMQLAEDGKCTLYSDTHDEIPKWSINGGNKKGTRNLVCCKKNAAASHP